jgi:cytochrome bd-type quinol oxidase subunit 1
MWIAVVAVLHVYTAMYAVGGSILIAAQTTLAHRTGDGDLLEYLRGHTWFFLLITVVYGSLFGVGIWWTIGLASPLATEDLIQIFVLGWAMEYVTFLLEIVSIFIFFYYWGRLAAKTHVQMGWIYAGAAFASLVIITGITAFQLNPGSWQDGNSFWRAWLNPQAFPQIAARTGGSLLLGALYFFLHSTLRIRDNDQLRERVGKSSAKWAMVGAALTIVGGFAWMAFLPPSGAAALQGAAVLNVLMMIIFTLTAGVVAMVYLVPLRNPSWLTGGFAILFFGLGLAATGAGEFIREAVRKPHIVYGRVLGSQVRPQEIARMRATGYLQNGVWTHAYVSDRFPEVMTEDSIDSAKLLSLSPAKRREVGQVLFQYHCGDCHATEGYSAVAQLARGWNRELVVYTVNNLDRVHFFMPPWSGTPEEAELLADYVMSIRHPYPPKLHPAGVKEGGR